MKTTLLMAMTVNGFVAGPNDDTEWVKDIDALYKKTVSYRNAIMGRRTYEECVKYNAFPYKGALNIVMTQDKRLHAQTSDDVIFTGATPREVLEIIEQKGFDHALVIGGGHINGSFLKEGLIDEIILDIHPLVIANGIKIFEGDFAYTNLEFVDITKLSDELLQVTYKVRK